MTYPFFQKIAKIHQKAWEVTPHVFHHPWHIYLMDFYPFFSSSKDFTFDFSMSHCYTRSRSEEISPQIQNTETKHKYRFSWQITWSPAQDSWLAPITFFWTAPQSLKGLVYHPNLIRGTCFIASWHPIRSHKKSLTSLGLLNSTPSGKDFLLWQNHHKKIFRKAHNLRRVCQMSISFWGKSENIGSDGFQAS